MSVQILIYAYFAVCAAMIVFNIACVIQFKRRDRASTSRDDRLKTSVREHVLAMKDNDVIDENHLAFLKKKCRQVGNLSSLDEELEALKEEHPDEVAAYTNQLLPLFSSLAVDINQKDSVQLAHYAYMLEKYHVVRHNPVPVITELMIHMVHSPNLYCRENALKVIYDIGSGQLVIDALLAVCNEGYFHHEKLIVDGLMRFTGDKNELIDLMVANLDKFNVTFQLYLLNHIRFSGARFDDLFFGLLTNPGVDDELRLCAMRYFGRNVYEPAYSTLYYYADNPSMQRWEYASVAATSLASYPRPETIEVLKNCLHNSNWFIRKNAAESLEKFNLGYFELADVLDGNDRYAREILQYRMAHQKYEKALKEGTV